MSEIKKLEIELSLLTQTSHGRRAFLAALPFLLASCASKRTSDRKREGDNTGQETSLSYKDEREMTKEYLPQMRKEYPAVKDQYAQEYIKNLGQEVVSRNHLRGKPYYYNFTLVNSKMVNAFALPAGEVFVTTPLLKMAETEAELAGVIGHEIGHIKARHTAERMEAAKKEQGKSLFYGAIGGLLGGAAGFGLGKLLCRKQDRECLRRAAMYGAAAGAGGGLLIQKFAFMANSREDEMEADRIGFITSTNTGYHKDFVGKFYEKLLIMEKKAKSGNNLMKPFVDAMSTHPPSKERVIQMKQMAKEKSLGQNKKINSNEFLKVQKRV